MSWRKRQTPQKAISTRTICSATCSAKSGSTARVVPETSTVTVWLIQRAHAQCDRPHRHLAVLGAKHGDLDQAVHHGLAAFGYDRKTEASLLPVRPTLTSSSPSATPARD